jgi:hypothetical protein
VSALWRCALVPLVQCASLSRGIGRTTCNHMVTRHTGGGQQARGTSDYTGPFCVQRWPGGDPVSSTGARSVRCPFSSDVDCTAWSPPSVGPFHDRPSAPCVGPGARPKYCALSVDSVAVLGVDDSGCGTSVRLDHHRGSGRRGAA